jgi:hypothetical protein
LPPSLLLRALLLLKLWAGDKPGGCCATAMRKLPLLLVLLSLVSLPRGAASLQDSSSSLL